MTAGADLSLDVSLSGTLADLARGVSRLCDRMDKEARLRQRANEALRQVPFIINVPLVAGAANLNPTVVGPDIGYYWSVRKLAAVGFTAGTVSTYIDSTGGEPLMPFTQAAVVTIGGAELLMHPNSSIAVLATGITGTVQIWGAADQFETWLLPWYIGGQRDE